MGYGDQLSRGLNVTREMGDKLPTVDLGSDETNKRYKAFKLSSGYYHNCVLLSSDLQDDTGVIKCWGMCILLFQINVNLIFVIHKFYHNKYHDCSNGYYIH